MATLITSQHYLDPNIVADKLQSEDFAVSVSPVFEVDGESYQVVLDGNHSLAAAVEAGCEPEITVMSVREHDAIGLLTAGGIEDFLAAVWMDGEYIDAITRTTIW